MKRFVRQAPDVLRVDNPAPTPEMAEFAVKQEFKKEVDINYIMEQARKGVSPPAWMTANTPRYGDFSDMPATFQEAFQIVEEANAAFMSLPLEMRKELDHNPQNLDFADKAMYEKYGLLRPKESVDAGSVPRPAAAVLPSNPEGGASSGPKGPKKANNVPKNENAED